MVGPFFYINPNDRSFEPPRTFFQPPRSIQPSIDISLSSPNLGNTKYLPSIEMTPQDADDTSGAHEEFSQTLVYEFRRLWGKKTIGGGEWARKQTKVSFFYLISIFPF